MAQISGRKFSRMEVRDLGTNRQDDAKEGYHLDACEMRNFGEEISKFKSIVRTETKITRTQLIL